MDARTDAAVPRPVSAGPEMDALSRFYRDVTWKGVIHEGGMGPGTPAMTRNEMATPDGSWFLIEQYAMVPRSPDDQDRAVGEVDHLVRRTAQD